MVFSTWCRNPGSMGSCERSEKTARRWRLFLWWVLVPCLAALTCGLVGGRATGVVFGRHVLPWGSLGWKRVAVLGCGEDHHRSVNAYWSARGFPIIGTFVWGRSYQWSWRRTWFLLLVMGAADGRGTSASTWVWQLRIPEALGFVDPLGSVGFVLRPGCIAVSLNLLTI